MNVVTISETVVKNILDAAIEYGITLNQLKRSGIDYDDLTLNPDARIGMEKYFQMESKLKELVRDEGFFLYIGSVLDPIPLSIKYIISNSSDNWERINYVLRYLRLICEAYRMALIEQEDNAEIYCHVSPSHYQTVSTVQMVMSNIVGGLKATYQEGINIIRINFQQEHPGYDQLYRDFFKTPIWFNQTENSVVFQKDVLSMMHSGQPYLQEVLIQHADRLLKELDVSKEFSNAISKIIIENLHTGNINIRLVERAVNMSRQTIYRRLKSENISFSTLLDEIRKERATEYLKTKTMKIEEIAFLLGYSETSAFNHAFRRWFGRRVGEYRKNTTG